MNSATRQQAHGYVEVVGRLRLHYRAWEVPQARAALAVLHGLGEHSGRYAPTAAALAASGIATYALDLRGHGSSEGRRGHVGRFELFLQDADRFRREIQGLVDPSTPLFLLGQGLGGLVALRYLEEYDSPYRGGILVSPWLAGAVKLPRWKVNLAAFLSKLLPALPLSARIRARDLSHDDEVVAAYSADALVHRAVTPRLLTETAAAMGLVLQRADRLRTPLLCLLPGDDLIGDSSRGGAAVARALQAPDATLRIFPGLYHDLLGETDRSAVRAVIRDWLDSHLPTRT